MKTAHFLRLDKTTNQDLSAGPLSYTTNFGRKFKLEQVLFNFSQAISETVTITQVSKHGANYNTILQEVVLVSETSLVYRPHGEVNFQDGDEIKAEVTNANGIGTVYATIKTSEM